MRTAPAAPLSVDDIRRLRTVIFRLARNLRNHYTGEVTLSEATMIAALMRHGPSSIGQLAAYEHMQPPSASRIIASLERNAFVERTSDPADRRSVRIALTPAALEYVDNAQAATNAWLAGRIDDLSPEDVDHLRNAMPALERLLSGME